MQNFRFMAYISRAGGNAKKKLSESEAYTRLSALCAVAEYCTADMLKKMEKWELPEGAEERIMDKLKAEKFIDEQRYARAFVRDKFRYNHWGRKRIGMELGMKGIDKNVCLDALEEIDEEEYTSMLKQLIESKKKTFKGKTPYEVKMKLMRFAAGRGFEPAEISRCLDCGDIWEE